MYLYVFAQQGTVTEEAREKLRNAYPQPFGRRPRILGLEAVDALPAEDNEAVAEACLRACKEDGIDFRVGRDELTYEVKELEDKAHGSEDKEPEKHAYGVCEIYIAPRVVLPVFLGALMAFLVGLGLGVTSPSVWLVVAGLVGFAAYLYTRGRARERHEGWVFATGPIFLTSWLVGFVVHGLVF